MEFSGESAKQFVRFVGGWTALSSWAFADRLPYNASRFGFHVRSSRLPAVFCVNHAVATVARATSGQYRHKGADDRYPCLPRSPFFHVRCVDSRNPASRPRCVSPAPAMRTRLTRPVRTGRLHSRSHGRHAAGCAAGAMRSVSGAAVRRTRNPPHTAPAEEIIQHCSNRGRPPRDRHRTPEHAAWRNHRKHGRRRGQHDRARSMPAA